MRHKKRQLKQNCSLIPLIICMTLLFSMTVFAAKKQPELTPATTQLN